MKSIKEIVDALGEPKGRNPHVDVVADLFVEKYGVQRRLANGRAGWFWACWKRVRPGMSPEALRLLAAEEFADAETWAQTGAYVYQLQANVTENKEQWLTRMTERITEATARANQLRGKQELEYDKHGG